MYYAKKKYAGKAKGVTKKRNAVLSKNIKDNIKRAIKKEIAPEIKYHSTQVLQADNRLVTNGTVSIIDDLCAVGQDITDSKRLGDDIKIKSLEVKLSLESLDTHKSGSVRVLIFQWHSDSTYMLPTPAYIYMSSVSGTIDALSFFNEDIKTAQGITVLYDRLIPISPAGLFDNGGDQISKSIKVPLKWAKKNVKFTNGATTGRDHIFMIINADRAGAGTDAVQMKYIARMHFTDA